MDKNRHDRRIHEEMERGGVEEKHRQRQEEVTGGGQRRVPRGGNGRRRRRSQPLKTSPSFGKPWEASRKQCE
eukprot:8554075-Pyramimonas_sp.AAC.1